MNANATRQPGGRHAAEGRIGAINGLRGIAILGVVWHHLWQGFLVPAGFFVLDLGPLPILPFSPLSNGWLGVNLFFILSGFVLYYPYLLGRRKLTGWADAGTFYARRGRRLLPLFYLSLCIFIGIDYLYYQRLFTPSELILYFTATFNFTEATFFPSPNGLLWTLGLEIWFSLFFPALVVLARRYGVHRVLLLTLLISLMVRLLGNHDPGNNVVNWIKDSIFGRLDDFVVGMWLCAIYTRGTRVRFPNWLLLVSGFAMLFTVTSLWEYVNLQMMPMEIRPFLNNIFQVGAACIVLALLHSDSRILFAIFANRPLQLIGLMTFSIYVWHWRLIGLMYDWFGILAWTGVAPMVVYLSVMLLVSVLSYRFVEFWHVKDSRQLFLTAARP